MNVLSEKKLVKTYDPTKGEFVYFKYDSDPTDLEKIRYVNTKINILNERLTKLQTSLQNGTFEFSEEEIKAKMQDFEKKVKIINSKLDLYGIIGNESKQIIDGVKEFSKEKVSVSEVTATTKRIFDLEKKYSFLSTPKIKNVFLNMIETVEVLSSRTKNIETSLNNIRDLNWNEKVRAAKKAISEEKRTQEKKKSESDWVKITSSLYQLKFENKKNKEKK